MPKFTPAVQELENTFSERQTGPFVDRGGSVGFDARAYGAVLDGTTDDGNAMADAITAAQTSGIEVVTVAGGTALVGSDLTVPAGVTLRVPEGAKLKPANGVTLTINGAFEAGLYQTFDTSAGGTIAFGPGAVERVLPQWWGVKGDGVTDDRPVAQRALDAAAAAGIKAVFRRGNYALGGAINLASGLALEIEEGATLKLVGAVDAHILRATSAISDVTICGHGTLDGTGATTANLIDLAGATRVRILDVELKNAARAAIRVTTATHFTVRGVRIHDCSREGVVVQDGSDITIEPEEMYNLGRSGVRITPTTGDVERVQVKGFTMTNIATDASAVPWGVYFNSGDDYIVKKSKIADVIVDGSGYGGIFPGGDDNEVSNCQAWNCAFDGLWIHDSRGIVVTGGIYGLNGLRGIRVGKAHEVSILGVRTYRNQQEGIKLEYSNATTGRYQGTNTNRDVVVIGTVNTENSQESAGTYAGITLTGNMRNCIVVANLGLDRQAAPTQQRAVSGGSEGSGNIVIANIGDGVTNANSVVAQNVDFSDFNRQQPWQNLAQNEAQPGIKGNQKFKTNNTTPTTITDFVGAVEGKEIFVRIADGNTTIQNNANIVTKSGADITTQGMYHFISENGVWYEI